VYRILSGKIFQKYIFLGIFAEADGRILINVIDLQNYFNPGDLHSQILTDPGNLD
jgi:hypothetical protein